jgi:hypothetical protein
VTYRGRYATRPQDGSGASSIGSLPRSGCTYEKVCVCSSKAIAVDDEVDEVLGLLVFEPAADKAELARGLLAALREVAFVEGEAKLAVLEHEVVAGAVVSALVEHELRRPGPWASASYARLLRPWMGCTRTCSATAQALR